jgi:putative YhbY family RNA-binding protein
MTPLTPKRRSELRAEAHKLAPVVIIGDKGLTDLVVAEIDRSLKAHELIKVRAFSDDRKARGEWMEAICERLGAQAVQQIGKVFVLYRENPKEEPPKRKPRAAIAEPEPVARRRAPPRDFKRAPRAGFKRKPEGDSRRKPEGDFKRKPEGDFKRKPQAEEVKGTSRPRSRTPSPRPESEPRRRRPRTSR